VGLAAGEVHAASMTMSRRPQVAIFMTAVMDLR